LKKKEEFQSAKDHIIITDQIYNRLKKKGRRELDGEYLGLITRRGENTVNQQGRKKLLSSRALSVPRGQNSRSRK